MAQRPLRLFLQAGMMKRTVKILLLLALSSAFLSGCNTHAVLAKISKILAM
jgi:entericidin A